jgi:glyoxylase-like metal-dependent hydrolase (beta-lactamase superfamily II)
MEPIIHTTYEPQTGTWQYIVADPATRQAAIIDAVLDYNKETGRITTTSADHLLSIIANEKYQVRYILETHAHADHLTASRYLQSTIAEHEQVRPIVGIGEHITEVQQTMAALYNIPRAELIGAFDKTFADGDLLQLGESEVRVIYLPGHTPDHIGYIIGRNVFTGDSIFNPDVGSARCDFPGGSATDLYHSMEKLLSLPKDYKLYTGHDYPPKDRRVPGKSDNAAIPYTTVEEQAAGNKHVKRGTKIDEFVRWRRERDNTLSEPKLLKQSMHVNIRGGRIPSLPDVGFDIASAPQRVPVL